MHWLATASALVEILEGQRLDAAGDGFARALVERVVVERGKMTLAAHRQGEVERRVGHRATGPASLVALKVVAVGVERGAGP